MSHTGKAMTGEGSAAAVASGFPIGYVIMAILGFCVAGICYFYPVKYVVCAGIGTMYYILHYWLFWGKKGIASAFPATTAIPVLLLYAFIVGALLAMLASGIDLLWKMYRESENSATGDQ